MSTLDSSAFSKWMQLIGACQCPKSMVRTVKISRRAPHWSNYSWLISSPSRCGAGSQVLPNTSPGATGRPAEKPWWSPGWPSWGDGMRHTTAPHPDTHSWKLRHRQNCLSSLSLSSLSWNIMSLTNKGLPARWEALGQEKIRSYWCKETVLRGNLLHFCFRRSCLCNNWRR